MYVCQCVCVCIVGGEDYLHSCAIGARDQSGRAVGGVQHGRADVWPEHALPRKERMDLVNLLALDFFRHGDAKIHMDV